ncbi:MAG: hypothetical protein QOG17_1202 [Gammaproteobacteria bacterium]|jgi:hypothetical protein|nr:hypothetical protein [Gammaproteobacteria bacterium]
MIVRPRLTLRNPAAFFCLTGNDRDGIRPVHQEHLDRRSMMWPALRLTCAPAIGSLAMGMYERFSGWVARDAPTASDRLDGRDTRHHVVLTAYAAHQPS